MKFAHIKKILIIRLSSLGDIILTTPLLRSLKEKYPEMQIDFCIREEFHDVIRHSPYKSEVYIYKPVPEAVAELTTQIVANKYDAILDLQNNFRTKQLLKDIKVPIFKFKKHSIAKFLLVNFKLKRLSNLPQIPVRYAKALKHFELDNSGADIFLPEGITSDLPPSDKYIGLCPGSIHYTKMWPSSYYSELGEILNLHRYKVVLFGGKKEKALCESFMKHIPGAINLCNDDDLYRTCINMKQCKAVVTNDSGLMHVAAAMNIPVLAIFGSTVKEFGFTPYKTKSTVIENFSLKCRPCSHIGRSECPEKHFQCMMALSPIAIYQNLTYLLAKK